MCLADERTRMNLNPDHQLKRFVGLGTFFYATESEQDTLFQALDEAGYLKQFQESVKTAMDKLKGEIDSALKLFTE